MEAKGWYVIIVWECELEKSKFQGTLDRVTAQLRINREEYLRFKEERRIAREAYRQTRAETKKQQEILKSELKELRSGKQ